MYHREFYFLSQPPLATESFGTFKFGSLRVNPAGVIELELSSGHSF